METAVTARGERRAAPRLTTVEEHGIVSARIRPGHHARLVDVSTRGVLVETPYRLLPGASVELRLTTRRHQHLVVRGEVVRCAVTRLRPVIYRGAIRIDRGYAIPANDPITGPVLGEEATHGLL